MKRGDDVPSFHVSTNFPCKSNTFFENTKNLLIIIIAPDQKNKPRQP